MWIEEERTSIGYENNQSLVRCKLVFFNLKLWVPM